MPRLKTFLGLGLEEKLAFARAWSYLAGAKLGIRFLGLKRTLRLLAPERPAATPRTWPLAARWMPVAVRYCPNGGHCLGRSVALLGLLRRAGVPAELRIGVRPGEPEIQAHAWVEVDGVPVNDARDVGSQYSSFRPIGTN